MRVALLLLAPLICLTSCTTTEARSEHGYGKVEIVYSTVPAVIRCNELFEVHLVIKAPAIEQVQVHATQPSTRVALLDAPQMVDLGGGHWVAYDMLLHLPGAWEITVDLAYNRRLRHYTYPVQL